MNIKPNWQKIIRKGVTYTLIAIVASAITVAALGVQNAKLTELQNAIDWKFMGQASMEQAREELEAEKLELEASMEELEADKLELEARREELEAVRTETEKLLEQLLTTNQEMQDLLEKAQQESGMVDEKIDELLNAYEEAEQIESQRWVMPIKYTRVSSPFGYRIHPIEGQSKFHYGVDLQAPSGTPIVASRSGTVSKASYEADGAGYYVNIDHLDGYVTRYMHMTRYIVSPGQFVFAGQIIGYCGSTGAATGPHLHFGVYYNGDAVNPAKFLDI